jgi:hypothetical protein
MEKTIMENLSDVLKLVKNFTDENGNVSLEQLSALFMDESARTLIFSALQGMRSPAPLVFGTRECPNCGFREVIFKHQGEK